MLPDLDAVVLDAAQRITVSVAREFGTAGRRPGGGRYLHNHSCPAIVPGQYALGMAQGVSSFFRAIVDDRVIVELIVSNEITVRSVIDLVERSADRVGRSVAGAIHAPGQGPVLIAGIGELRAELDIMHDSPAKRTNPRGASDTLWK